MVPACNKTLASQDDSGVVTLPQATSPSSFAAVQGLKTCFHLTAQLKEDLHLQSKLFPKAMLGHFQQEHHFTAGHSHQAVCLLPV